MAFAAASPHAFPAGHPVGRSRFSDLLSVGGGTVLSFPKDQPYNRPDPDPQGSRVYEFCDRLIEDFKAYRNLYDQNWNYYIDMLEGRQWQQPNTAISAPPTMDPWRAMLNINYIWPIVDTEISQIFDNDPRIILSATASEQRPYWEVMQAGLDQVWSEEEIILKAQEAQLVALTLGIGWLKFGFDPSADEGQGAIWCTLVPSEYMYVDRACTSLKDCEALIELQPRPVSYLRSMYPKARFVSPETTQGTYGELRMRGINFNPNIRSAELLSPGGDDPHIGDKTQFSVRPWRQAMQGTDYMVDTAEIWLRDKKTTEWVEKEYTYGHDQMGNPLRAKKKFERLKFPHGRVITIAGGMVLQDCANSYECLPYVIFRNIPRPGQFYSKSEIELLADAQRELNKRRSQIVDNAAQMGSMPWIVDKESDVPSQMLDNAPGRIIRINHGYNVRRDPPPEMPNWIMSATRMPIDDMMVQAGVTGSLSGAPPKGARSGSAMVEGNAIMTQRTRRKSKYTEQSLKDCGKIIIRLMQKFYTTAHTVRVKGNYGTSAFVPFDGWHRRGRWDCKIEAGSQIATSKSVRRQEAMQLFGMHAITLPNLLKVLEWEDRDELLREMQYPGAQMMVPQYPGWPGIPNPNNTDHSGYALSVRAAPIAPQAQPGLPAGPAGPPGPGGGHVQNKPPRTSPPGSAAMPFGRVPGSTVRRS